MQKFLTDELDERAFLFIRQPGPDDELLGRITRDKIDLLCVFSRLELGVVIRSRFLQDRGVCWVYFLFVCC